MDNSDLCVSQIPNRTFARPYVSTPFRSHARSGNAAAVSRLALIERMEATASSDIYQWEVARRARVAEELERTQREIAARRVQIPIFPDVHRGPTLLEIADPLIVFPIASEGTQSLYHCP